MVIERPLHTIQTNIKATELPLGLASRRRKGLLITSTPPGGVWCLDKPKFAEDDDLVLASTSRARRCYAASKIIDEFLAKAYFKERGLPVVIVRLFNTIGSGQTRQYGMVVPAGRAIGSSARRSGAVSRTPHDADVDSTQQRTMRTAE